MSDEVRNVRTRWSTPLSDCRDSEFCYLECTSDLSLNVYVWGQTTEGHQTYCRFTWDELLAHRQTSDFQIQYPIFGPESARDFSTGCTCYANNSVWAEDVERHAITKLPGKLIHFVILTITHEIEILSAEEPHITQLSELEVQSLGISKQTYIPVNYDAGRK